jgi:hypothetical protein
LLCRRCHIYMMRRMARHRSDTKVSGAMSTGL